jgi:hypothetical protein
MRLTDLLLIALACFCVWAVNDPDGATEVLRHVANAAARLKG